ncbi:YqjF family protein [Streptomyces sp. NPDC056653]|uniref:YqjF family protein n=1 Tax=Streptomyces sp. NPDC056653 TaxID=3345894 RepID=UPI0036C07E21
MLTARWLSQTFVHWPYPPEEVQALLPRGLQVDVSRNAAWVGITPFLMASVKVLGAVPLPVSTFNETNVRTYARLPDGRNGLWFLSIDVSNPVMLAARVIGAPYHVGNLKIRTDGPVIHYTGERRGGGSRYRLAVRPGAPAEVTELDVWLTSRWRSFTQRAGVLLETPVEHEPTGLWHAGRSSICRRPSPRSACPSAPVGEPVVHFSSRVGPVRLGATRPARAARTSVFSEQTLWGR